MNSDSPIKAPSRNRQSGVRFWLFVAILGSLLGHAALWFWFQFIRLPQSTIPTNEKLILRKFKLARVQINPKWAEPKVAPPERVSPTPSPDRSSLVPPEEKRSFAKLLEQTPSSPTMPAGSPQIPQEKPVPVLGESEKTTPDITSRTALDETLKALQEQQLKLPTKTASAGRPILSNPGAPVAPKPSSTELAPPTHPKVGPSQGSAVGTENANALTGSSRLDDFFGVGGLPIPDSPKPLPPMEKKDIASLFPQSLPKDAPQTTQKFESINSFLNIEIFNYEQPGASGKLDGYFLVRISAKPQSKLPVIPKDVYFVLDISSSIGGKRLEEFAATVLAVIPQLNPDDRFKILAFRDKLTSFRSDWTPAQNPPMEDLKKWFENAHTAGVTDFYEGLQPLVQHSRKRGRMAMALVMSDGVPTKGILDSTQIISDFSKANNHKSSIFTLSSGYDVNNFLLDLLSYSNQGRLKYSKDVPGSKEVFVQLAEQVQNPLFLDLRFRFAGVDGSRVYPQNLPHLYQDNPVLLFGRYTPGQTDPISLQILGEGLDATREILIQIPLPKQPNGPETLPSTWARQKIYDLLSEMTASPARQERILSEVRKLSEEYKIQVPYF